MIATYKVLSAALSYPTAELQSAASELFFALSKERLLPARHRAAIGVLLRDIAKRDLVDAQSRYVDLFDRTRSLSLHLFEHVHGESRDRGQAMVSLLERYQQAGLDIEGSELPDFIPLFLEFLSTQSTDESRATLTEPLHIFAAIGERLRRRNSEYAVVFEALVSLSKSEPNGKALEELGEHTLEDPSDLIALDRAWEEVEVRFGPGDPVADGCPRVSDILNKMDAAFDEPASAVRRRLDA